MFYCFVPPADIADESIRISGPNARHLRLVLRAQPGEPVRVRSDSFLYETVVDRVEKDCVLVRILSRSDVAAPPGPLLVLASALIQEKRFDLVLQSACQLGVSVIRPLLTEHTAEHRIKAGKKDRWQRIIEESCMQAQNPSPPFLEEPCFFREMVEEEKRSQPAGLLLMPWELEPERRMDRALLQDRSRIVLFIGPEGGWSPAEIAEAKENGIVTLTLGPRILRTETAVTVALTLLRERTDSL